eukprot:1445765-Amphidinium_carterae.1
MEDASCEEGPHCKLVCNKEEGATLHWCHSCVMGQNCVDTLPERAQVEAAQHYFPFSNFEVSGILGGMLESDKSTMAQQLGSETWKSRSAGGELYMPAD